MPTSLSLIKQTFKNCRPHTSHTPWFHLFYVLPFITSRSFSLNISSHAFIKDNHLKVKGTSCSGKSRNTGRILTMFSLMQWNEMSLHNAKNSMEVTALEERMSTVHRLEFMFSNNSVFPQPLFKTVSMFASENISSMDTARSLSFSQSSQQTMTTLTSSLDWPLKKNPLYYLKT